MVSEYEKQRQLNIEKNTALLRSLGLEKLKDDLKQTISKPRTVTNRKRKPVFDEDDDKAVHPPKASRTSEGLNLTPESGVRRSSRNVGKTIDYKGEIAKVAALPIAYSSGVKCSENTGPLGREDGPRRYDPKTYGSIPDIEVGTWWESRKGCSADAIHAPWVGGISGGPDGAYSVALSGGYDDDVDLGYAFTYTGSGGRDLKGTKNAPKNLRTAPQSFDQSFDNPFNKMILRSCENKKPVRVIRGFKLKSIYAPSEGYRYDGLYRVERAWMEKSLNTKGFLVCKFAFKRLPSQPPLPVETTDEKVPEATEDQIASASETEEGTD